MNSERIASYVNVAEERLARWIGVDLTRGGVASTVRRHVETRARALGDPGSLAFAALLDAHGSSERRALIEAATVPHSWLFRDAVQLEAVGAALCDRPRGPLAIWVAGCAGGEDAVTFTVLAQACGHTPTTLATDVNETALARARTGRFDAWRARELPTSARRAFDPDERDGVIAKASVKERIVYERHSVLDAIPTTSRADAFDLIVCRNVLIYFSRARATTVVETLAKRLSVGGLLVLGASDVLTTLPRGLVPRAGATRLVLVRQEARTSSMPAPAEPPVVEAARTPRSDIFLRGDLSVHVHAPAPRTASTPSRSSCEILAALDVGDLASARAKVEARLLARPDAETSLLAGLTLRALGDEARAARHLENACHALPGAWVAWLQLGLAYERLGRFDAARTALSRVPLATGEGEDLPRGGGETADALHGSRSTFARFAIARVAALMRGGIR